MYQKSLFLQVSVCFSSMHFFWYLLLILHLVENPSRGLYIMVCLLHWSLLPHLLLDILFYFYLTHIRKITMYLKYTEIFWNRLFQCFSIQTCTEKTYFSRFQYVLALCTFSDVSQSSSPAQACKVLCQALATTRLLIDHHCQPASSVQSCFQRQNLC